MENMFWIGFVGFALAIAFAWMQKGKVMSYSEGTEKMQKIAASIREGANAYLKHQYTTVAKVFAVVFVVLLIMAFASNGKMLSKFTPFAFLTGGVWSMLAGFIGMKIDLHIKDLNNALDCAHSVGAPLPMTASVQELLQWLHNNNCGQCDHSAIAKYYEQLTGIRIGR